jgi:hypothetical protein
MQLRRHSMNTPARGLLCQRAKHAEVRKIPIKAKGVDGLFGRFMPAMLSDRANLCKAGLQGTVRDAHHTRYKALGEGGMVSTKQARHRTGLPWRGRNGTVVSTPHSAQTV